jgi:anaerobic magnesium-protoporphyrin IX monomethyl ester cyclase
MSKKLLLLNIPNEEQITRRYMCSYVSPESLMPPLELISCGAVGRDWNNAEVLLIDAIAEKLDFKKTVEQIKAFQPDVILSLLGFECYQEDVDTLRDFKKIFHDTTFVLFGYYATQFPKETLQHSLVDYIILGEPEYILKDLLNALFADLSINTINGIAYCKDGVPVVQGTSGRIKDPNELPIPAYNLLSAGKYYEPLFARPYGMIQTIRGCPYQCNYCVKSYGTKIAQLTTERIIVEMRLWIDLFGIKSIRFIDDTFTINKRRVVELCQEIIRQKITVEWACLSRTDNLDMEMLTWMKKAGCKRIYFGMESGSQRILDIYKKNINVGEAMETLHLCRKAGIESAGFFMSGHPEETEQDFEETVAFAKSANLSYASFNPLKPYPGTSIFEEVKDRVNFSIYPYQNAWKDRAIDENYDRRKQIFYKAFYMRIGFFASNGFTLIKETGQFLVMGIKLLRYLWGDKRFIIGGGKAPLDN